MGIADELKMMHFNSILQVKIERIKQLEEIVKGYVLAHAIILKATT
tara:strand:- start:347 stop:484 length:138 start_codon:yes stop_codon:yes gene_type:complete